MPDPNVLMDEGIGPNLWLGPYVDQATGEKVIFHVYRRASVGTPPFPLLGNDETRGAPDPDLLTSKRETWVVFSRHPVDEGTLWEDNWRLLEGPGLDNLHMIQELPLYGIQSTPMQGTLH